MGGVFAGGIAPLAFQALYRRFETPTVVAAYTTAALVLTILVLLKKGTDLFIDAARLSFDQSAAAD